MKKILSALLVLLLVLSMAACGSSGSSSTTKDDNEVVTEPKAEATEKIDEITEVKKEPATLSIEDIGIVYVGIDGAYPPYCFLNENDAVDGFEVAVMNEIAARTGLTIECQITAWTSMFGQLDSGRIDTVAECITVTEERSATYNFSKSYIEDSNRFIVCAGKEHTISSFEDLAGKKIGVAAGQNAYEQLLAIREEYKVDFEIVPYESSTNAYDVSIGRLDASYMNPVAGMSMSNEGNMNLAAADCPAYVNNLCAYCFVKDSARADTIRELFNTALEEMKADGTLGALCQEWLGADISIVE